jgi:hypothetical protein
MSGCGSSSASTRRRKRRAASGVTWSAGGTGRVIGNLMEVLRRVGAAQAEHAVARHWFTRWPASGLSINGAAAKSVTLSALFNGRLFPMPSLDFNRQLCADVDSLREITAGLQRLEREVANGRLAIRVRRRGYFTPDDDDRTRQLLLAYRNYRLALYDIIHRRQDYAVIMDAESQVRNLLIGLAAGLTVYSKSLRLIRAFEREPLVRRKLNEADAKFGLPAGFFDEILRGCSSLRNYRAIARGQQFWCWHRREIQQLVRREGRDWAWLCDVIRREHSAVRRRLARILWYRVRFNWRALWRTTFRPVRRARYGVQSTVAGVVAGARTTRHYEPALNAEVLRELRPCLRPGDVLLIRAERKLTSALLPGFWAHAALYLGGRADLEALGLSGLAPVAKHWPVLDSDHAPFGSVIEAISPRVQINPLQRSLHADHVAVFRPHFAADEVKAALLEAFSHAGKPYDYEFDFNITDRIVCTELIYRSYHRRAGCEFPLVKRLGRFTLTGDDIAGRLMQWIDASRAGAPAPFELAALVLKCGDGKAHFFHSLEAMDAMRRIQNGWRPVRDAAAGNGVVAHG